MQTNDKYGGMLHGHREMLADEFPIWTAEEFWERSGYIAEGTDVWVKIPGLDLGYWAEIIESPWEPEENETDVYTVRPWGTKDRHDVARPNIAYVMFRDCECGRRMENGVRLCHPDA